MFGGEDSSRQLLNDIHILDLENMMWDIVESMRTPPAPRFDHTAALHVERYLLIFCGCSHSTCFNDLHVLDLQTMDKVRQAYSEDLSILHAFAIVFERRLDLKAKKVL